MLVNITNFLPNLKNKVLELKYMKSSNMSGAFQKL